MTCHLTVNWILIIDIQDLLIALIVHVLELQYFQFHSELQWLKGSWVSWHKSLTPQYCQYNSVNPAIVPWTVNYHDNSSRTVEWLKPVVSNIGKKNRLNSFIDGNTTGAAGKEMQASTWILLDRISPTSWQHSCFLSANAVCQLEYLFSPPLLLFSSGLVLNTGLFTEVQSTTHCNLFTYWGHVLSLYARWPSSDDGRLH